MTISPMASPAGLPEPSTPEPGRKATVCTKEVWPSSTRSSEPEAGHHRRIVPVAHHRTISIHRPLRYERRRGPQRNLFCVCRNLSPSIEPEASQAGQATAAAKADPADGWLAVESGPKVTASTEPVCPERTAWRPSSCGGRDGTLKTAR